MSRLANTVSALLLGSAACLGANASKYVFTMTGVETGTFVIDSSTAAYVEPSNSDLAGLIEFSNVAVSNYSYTGDGTIYGQPVAPGVTTIDIFFVEASYEGGFETQYDGYGYDQGTIAALYTCPMGAETCTDPTFNIGTFSLHDYNDSAENPPAIEKGTEKIAISMAPEPSGLWLLGSGVLAGLPALGRRLRKR
jgi:hypothetical protein